MFRPRLLTLFAALSLLLAPALAAEWHYVDGAGKAVALPAPPARIIAHSSVAAALLPYGIRPVGILRDGPPALDRALDGLDLADIPIVSTGWFEIDAEAVLNLDPDLIVTEYALAEKIYQGGTHEGAIATRLEAIAPVIGIPRGNSVMEMLDTYRAFAASLGADTETPALIADRARLERAIATLRSADAAKPGLAVMAASVSATGLSIALPAQFGELHDLAGWGIDLVSPEPMGAGSYVTLSWENAGQYHADLLLLDDRWQLSAQDIIAAQPLAQRLPAIRAGQIGDWPAEWVRSPGVYAQKIEELAGLIAHSHKLP